MVEQGTAVEVGMLRWVLLVWRKIVLIHNNGRLLRHSLHLDYIRIVRLLRNEVEWGCCVGSVASRSVLILKSL